MKVAVVGSGVAGLGAAWALRNSCELVLYESEARLGGHAHTVRAATGGGAVDVDTGFIVYNEPSYPNLVRLFDALGVETKPSDMSFAVSVDRGSFEYGCSPLGLFAQAGNLIRPRVWQIAGGVLHFYRTAPAVLAEAGNDGLTLGDYLAREGYSDAFVFDHLLPMTAAIWSTPIEQTLAFPLRSFVSFCRNHGLLLLAGRPQWRTVAGGSQAYVSRIAQLLGARVRTGCPVVGLRRQVNGVEVRAADGSHERFDQVVLACHADRALAILGQDASAREREVLSAFRYEANRVVLHQDARLMPRRRKIWSSWNYLSQSTAPGGRKVAVTYWMNRLQSIDPATPLFVSLNPFDAPAEDSVLGTFDYDHPRFDPAALAAQKALPEIEGANRTWFCGSYCGHGFHEDGLQSGLQVARALGGVVPWAGAIEPVSPAAANCRPAQAPARAA